MKTSLFILAVCLFLFSAGQVVAQEVVKGGSGGQYQTGVSNVGTNAAAFLEIGVGARAMAMGGAYVAVANDPTALYYNPAGIVWMQNIQLELMHNEWLVDTNYDFVGVTMPLPFWNISIGAGMIMLNYGEQPVRTETRPEGTGETYGARDYAASFTVASALTQRFSFGLTGKYINQKIWNASGGIIALDGGIFYSTPLKGLRLGMSMSNFGGELRITGRELHSTVDPDPDNENISDIPVSFQTGSYPLPLLFRAGISYSMNWGSLGEILLVTDLLHPSNSSESINFGIEYGYGGIFFLRAGYENTFEQDAINGLTLGGGIDYYEPGKSRIGFRVDYAYSDWGVLQNAHRFSIGLIFD